jgi:tetratricopeptide (TPR) repeat protein
MNPTRLLLVGLIALAAPALVRADFPDVDYSDRLCIQLRAMGLKPFPIYSRTTDQGVLGLNDGKIYWGGDARVFMPKGWYKRTDESGEGRVAKPAQALGWQSDGVILPQKGMTFVNVGYSTVTVNAETMRRGDYVTYDGSKFVRGTFRLPDRVRNEPEDTNRELAAEMLTKAKLLIALNEPARAKVELEQLTRTYPDTKSASDALKMLERFNTSNRPGRKALADLPTTDLGSWANEDGRTAEQIAIDLLALGKVKAALKQYDGARVALRTIIDRYPNSKQAEQAFRVIESLPADAQVRR